MKVNFKQRDIWRNLVFAIGLSPVVAIISLIVITLVGVLDDAITNIQIKGHWWIFLIIGFILSLIYLSYEPKFRRNRARNKYVSSLILYWEAQHAKQNMPQPSEREIEMMREQLLERVKVWARSDPKLWADFYPDEKYSESPFDILDGITTWWKEWEEEHKKSRTK